MTTKEITNTDDLIDSRDVIARFEQLELELTDAFEGMTSEDHGTFDEWIDSEAMEVPS